MYGDKQTREQRLNRPHKDWEPTFLQALGIFLAVVSFSILITWIANGFETVNLDFIK